MMDNVKTNVDIDADLMAAIDKLSATRVQWGAVSGKTDTEHVSDFADSLRITRDDFCLGDENRDLHGVYLAGTETVLCHTGNSPNSAANARLITWLINAAPTIMRIYEQKAKMQKDAGLKFPPTDFTMPFRLAMNGEGERAFEWTDKPHRLVYDLCSELERSAHRIAELEIALRPFAAIPPVFLSAEYDETVYGRPEAMHYWCVMGHPTKSNFTREDLQRAKEAIGVVLATEVAKEPSSPVPDATDDAGAPF